MPENDFFEPPLTNSTPPSPKPLDSEMEVLVVPVRDEVRYKISSSENEYDHSRQN